MLCWFSNDCVHISSSSSAFPATLDFQSSEKGKVHSLLQCLHWSPELLCGHPLDWAMYGIPECQRWGRTAGCGWGFKDLCCKGIHLTGKISVCGGGRGIDSSQPTDCDLNCSVQLVDAVLFSNNVKELLPLCPEAVSWNDLCFAFGHGVCRLHQFAPIFDIRPASSLPPTPQWEGIPWRVTDVLFLSRDISCLIVADDLLHLWWLETLQNGP